MFPTAAPAVSFSAGSSIRLRCSPGSFRMEIENDGVTTYDDLMKIQTLLSDEPLPEGTGSASLGIRNVHERVKIIYGQESGLSITITEKGNTLSRMNIKFEQDGQ